MRRLVENLIQKKRSGICTTMAETSLWLRLTMSLDHITKMETATRGDISAVWHIGPRHASCDFYVRNRRLYVEIWNHRSGFRHQYQFNCSRGNVMVGMTLMSTANSILDGWLLSRSFKCKIIAIIAIWFEGYIVHAQISWLPLPKGQGACSISFQLSDKAILFAFRGSARSRYSLSFAGILSLRQCDCAKTFISLPIVQNWTYFDLTACSIA